jgi:hypoxanthine phosphoribosyltransferase
MRTVNFEKTRYFLFDWKDINKELIELAKKIDKKPEMIVGILRGGGIVAILLSDLLGVKELRLIGARFYDGINRTKSNVEIYQGINSTLKEYDVLLVDEVVDTGKTLEVVKNRVLALNPKSLKVAALHIKPWTTIKPDYFVRVLDGWINYPWSETEFIKEIFNKLLEKYPEEKVKGLIKNKFGISSKDLKLALKPL